MKPEQSTNSSLRTSFVCVLLSLALIASVGCGGSNAGSQSGLPPSPPASENNSYVGQPGNSPTENALWNVNINRSNNTYSYGPSGGTTTSGSIATVTGINDFVILLGQNGYQSGLAVEVPGQGVLLRAGGDSVPLVFAVQQASCFSIGGNVKFFYAFSPGFSGINTAFYGEIYAGSNSGGDTWQFNNQTNFTAPYQFLVLEGSSVPSNATFPGYPANYPANCSAASGAANVSASPLAYFNQGNDSFTVPTQFAISTGGLFFENQNYTSVPSSEGWLYPNIAAWGVSQSTQPFLIGNVAAANYLGFLFESNASSGLYRTRLVGFGNQTTISGTTMTGGTFPSEDPTQPVTTNMSVTFNSQDPLNAGVYYDAKLTIPDDSPNTFTDSCLTYGTSQTGSPTCTNDGVALVGKPNGLFTVIMSATDTSGDQETLVLFQQ